MELSCKLPLPTGVTEVDSVSILNVNRPQNNQRKAEQVRKYTQKVTILQHVFDCAY